MKDLVARDVMNWEIFKVRDNMTVQELAAFLTEEQISGAPVVESSNKMGPSLFLRVLTLLQNN